MENTIKQVATPEDAVTQFVGEQYMEWLMEYFDTQVKSWPFLAAINQSQPKPEKVKKFMVQKFLAEQAFAGSKEGEPGFLGFAIANLSESSEPEAEPALEILTKKKAEEAGETSSTAKHWLKLLSAIGLPEEEIKRMEPKEPTRTYIADLSDVYSTAEWLATMAAYFTHEKLSAIEFPVISTMLKNSLNVTDDQLQALANSKADARQVTEVKHLLEKSAVDQESKQNIFDGLRRQLQVSQEFNTALTNYLYEQ